MSFGSAGFGESYFGQGLGEVGIPTTVALINRRIAVSLSKDSWPVSVSKQSSPVTVKNDKVVLGAIQQIKMTQH